MTYESTRNQNITATSSEALLQGLASDGGLFVTRDIPTVDYRELMDMDYKTMAFTIMSKYFDMPEDMLKSAIDGAYTDTFESADVTPVVKLSDGYILELFRGPTSAFKDVALQILPRLISNALKLSDMPNDILILTATSGDTGKAALAGFKDVDRTKIIVFYPYGKVSDIQRLQMATQEGSNVSVIAIEGNFDDAQSAVKALFLDKDFLEVAKSRKLQLSSANSINIGRLVPQIVYYFYGYASLVKSGDIKLGDKVNFAVPTGNFGDILAGYLAKSMGLPINKLICASNKNNVLADFLSTGTYSIKRDFHTTISPSMDILISSNLERLLYYVSGKDNSYINTIMSALKKDKEYKLKSEYFDVIQSQFLGGYADDVATKKTIAAVYSKDKYLLDPHTAVAYKVYADVKDRADIACCKTLVLATASPYKFSQDVLDAISDDKATGFDAMAKLRDMTGVPVHEGLASLAKKPVLHNDVVSLDGLKDKVTDKIMEMTK